MIESDWKMIFQICLPSLNRMEKILNKLDESAIDAKEDWGKEVTTNVKLFDTSSSSDDEFTKSVKTA